MAFETKWYIPNRVIFTAIVGDLNDQDVREFGDILQKMIQEGTAPLHLLVNSSQQQTPRLNMKETVSSLSVVKNPKMGWIINYGQAANPLVKFLSTAVTRVLGVQYRTFATEAEALAFLRHSDNSLGLENA